MANEFMETAVENDSQGRTVYSIVSGVVTNNIDLTMEGRVQVHLPSFPDIDPWARVTSVMAGMNRGFFFIPQIDDEVLVAFNQDDVNDAYVLGGLWNTLDRPPGVTSPIDALNKRIIKTGIAGAVGHEIEFDDALQSVTISTSTEQKIVMDPTKIEISNIAGTVKITMDNEQQSITIQAAATLELKAPRIKIQGTNVDIEGAAVANVKSGVLCQIKAPMVKIN